MISALNIIVSSRGAMHELLESCCSVGGSSSGGGGMSRCEAV